MSPNKNTLSVYLLVLILIPILGFAVFLRLYSLGKTPLEVDEPINYAAAASIITYGFPSVKPPVDAPRQIYLFHPFVGYQLMAGWFELTGLMNIVGARLLNIVASIIVLLLVFLFVLNKGRGTALFAAFFIPLDGWIVTINRMDYLENIQLILVVLGIWVFYRAVKTGNSQLQWLVAGLWIGTAVIYKLIGLFLVLVVLANWLLTRRHHQGHVTTLITIGAVLVTYVVIMCICYGQLYIDAQTVEFNRLFGFVAARGLNFGISTVISMILGKYWIYLTTVIALTFGWPLAAWRYIQALFSRSITPYDGVVLSWTIGGCVFAVASHLKSPHYLIMWLIPVYIFLAGEATHWFRGKRLTNVWIPVVFFLAASIFTWNGRFIQFQGDALRDNAAYINTKVPANVVVGTEPYLAEMIGQQYTKIESLDTVKAMDRNDYLAIYTSSTASIKTLPPLVQRWQQYCLPLQKFYGFKDQVVVCRIDHTVLKGLTP